MPRKRNQDTLQRIADAAWTLFMERGYKEASYAEIASASGINRATVQHYFPKKELMASLILQRLRESATEITAEAFPDVEDRLSRLYLLGQVYLAALICSDASCRFLCDVLEDRSLTDETISADFYWSQDYIGTVDNAYNSKTRDDMIVAMGGLYELMFYCVKNDYTLDIPNRLAPAFLIMSETLGISDEDCRATLKSLALKQTDLESLGRACFERAALPFTSQDT